MKSNARKTVAGSRHQPSEVPLPILPEPNAEGLYPALESMDILIARNIGTRRRQAGLSQSELAKKAGVRQETISRIEAGKHSATVRTIEKIERALVASGV